MSAKPLTNWYFSAITFCIYELSKLLKQDCNKIDSAIKFFIEIIVPILHCENLLLVAINIPFLVKFDDDPCGDISSKMLPDVQILDNQWIKKNRKNENRLFWFGQDQGFNT